MNLFRDERGDAKTWVIVTGMILAIIIAIGGMVYGESYLTAFTYDGQTYDVVVTVQAVEKSTRLWIHTDVWCLTYSGEDLMYRLAGYQDFVIGETYHIVFTNKIVWHWYGGYSYLGELETAVIVYKEVI